MDAADMPLFPVGQAMLRPGLQVGDLVSMRTVFGDEPGTVESVTRDESGTHVVLRMERGDVITVSCPGLIAPRE